MFSLFELKNDFGITTRLSNDWLNVKTGLKLELEKVMQYYKQHVYAVASDHLLVQLLGNINIPTHISLERYMLNLDVRCNDLTRVFGFTSSVYRGKVHYDNFFFGSTELILVDDSLFDEKEVYDNWRDVVAIEVIRHPVTTLQLSLPNGGNNSSDRGIAVLSINLQKLAVQYKAFRDNEAKLAKSVPDYQEKSVMQFVHMFVLPNMLPSILDGIVFNRLYCASIGMPFGEQYTRHPFHVIDWTKRLDRTLGLALEYLQQSKTSFTGALRSIGLVTKDNLEEYSQLPDIAKTRQVMWVLISSRLPLLIWLLWLNEKNGNSGNIKEVNILKRYFTRVKQNNQIVTQLPSAFRDELFEEIGAVSYLLDV